MFRFEKTEMAYMTDGLGACIPAEGEASVFSVYDTPRYTVLPGFCDVHVHFREPGFSYKETIETGSIAAARGGYTAVCTMPNLNPVPDSVEHLRAQTELIEKNSRINIYPYGAITVGEKGETLADMEALAPFVAAFSDDGRGVQNGDMMRAAMEKAASLGKIIAAHCEVDELLRGGYIHDGDYARVHSHRGISSESEWREVERDLKLAYETGCAFHVCHVSTRESVKLIRDAKKSGVDVTCETAPHYLLLSDSDLREEGRWKMNPPLRSVRDREALVEGIIDGTVDMIATDHAPHSAEEKSRGLEKAPFGVVGLECAFPMLYTYLVRTGALSMETLLERLVTAPRKRFSLPMGNDFSVWDLNREETICGWDFVSLGKATPFEGMRAYGKCVLTVADGKVAYTSNKEYQGL